MPRQNIISTKREMSSKGGGVKAIVTQSESMKRDTYIGMMKNHFKTRYNLHNSSFRLPNKRSTNTLSEHLRTLNDARVSYKAEWFFWKRKSPLLSVRLGLFSSKKLFCLFHSASRRESEKSYKDGGHGTTLSNEILNYEIYMTAAIVTKTNRGSSLIIIQKFIIFFKSFNLHREHRNIVNHLGSRLISSGCSIHRLRRALYREPLLLPEETNRTHLWTKQNHAPQLLSPQKAEKWVNRSIALYLIGSYTIEHSSSWCYNLDLVYIYIHIYIYIYMYGYVVYNNIKRKSS